jgi:hypothetical protein
MSSVIVVDKPVILPKIVKSIWLPRELKADLPTIQPTSTKNIKISWPKLAVEAVESDMANLQHVSRINRGNNLNRQSHPWHHGYSIS